MNLRFRHASKLILCAVWPLLLWSPAWAQTVPQAQILVIDTQQVINFSSLGQQVSAQLASAEAALRSENERISEALAEEERSITEQRDTLSPESFTALADAFDKKTQRLRSEQSEKLIALSKQREEMANDLLQTAMPILQDIMREAGAQALIDIKYIVLAADYLNITQEAIERINRSLQDGPSVSE